MSRTSIKTLAIGTAAAMMLAVGSVATAAGDTYKAGQENGMGQARRSVPAPLAIADWPAPQYLSLPSGVTTTGSMETSGGVQPKTTFTLAGFVPVTPCRLVDTRGVFSPVFGGPAFAANEVRNYVIPGNCGVPAGTSHVRGVSLQVTTPPTAASGDIEVIATGAALGGTVAMVIQAGQWNSVSITPGVNAAGSIQVQLRSTPGHVVIDINGYYANLNPAQDDVFSISGTHPGGGVLFVTNANAGGAAINAFNSSGAGSQVELAFGSNAIDVVGGDFRVRGAGVGTDTIAFRHQVGPGGTFSSGTGTLCSAGNDHVSMINHPKLNGNPNPIPIITMREVQSTGNFFPTGFPGVVMYYDDVGLCTGSGTNKWGVLRLDFNTWTVAQQFNVWVVAP